MNRPYGRRPVLKENSADDFVKSPNFIAACRDAGFKISASQREVLKLVYSFSTTGYDRCYWGSIEYACMKTGASERTVQRAFARLTELGLIYREIVSNRKRKYVANFALLDEIKAIYERQRREEWTLYRKARQGVAPDENKSAESEKQASPEVTTTKVAVSTAETHDEPTSFAVLLGLAVNRNLIRECEAPYEALLKQNFSAQEIISAWIKRQDECAKDGRPKHCYPQLKRWLMSEDPDGAKAMIEQVRARAEEDKQRKRNAAINHLIQEDAYAESLYRQMQFARTEAEKQQAKMRLHQYFDEVYGDAPTSRKGMPRCQQIREMKQQILSSA